MVVTLDLKLPRVHGRDIGREIKKEVPSLPVLVLAVGSAHRVVAIDDALCWMEMEEHLIPYALVETEGTPSYFQESLEARDWIQRLYATLG
jgi:hypothetical protein